MSNLANYAKDEFKIAGYYDGDEMNKEMADSAVRLLETFSGEGHSGFSASFALSLFKRLASFEPITPLTGEDSEWNDVADNLWQNRRCSRVFKDDKHAWDIEGKVFQEPDGGAYTSKDSFTEVMFPYTPTTEYVQITK